MEYCNPLDLAYKFQHYGKAAHREAADPTLVLFKGTYYLFASMSAGFYYSNDLASWQWHENRNLDMYLYAPDARQIGDYLYFCASSKGESSTIWRTKAPCPTSLRRSAHPLISGIRRFSRMMTAGCTCTGAVPTTVPSMAPSWIPPP